jgi:hypothetical protein
MTKATAMEIFVPNVQRKEVTGFKFNSKNSASSYQPKKERE